MRNPVLMALVIATVVLAACSQQPVAKATQQDLKDPSPQANTTTISATQLAAHNTYNDCWVGYKGKAYDITSFLPNHPGQGESVARYCGTSTEFQDAFIAKHGESKVDLFMRVATYEGVLGQ